MNKFNDLPEEKAIEMAQRMVSKGWNVRVKWTCERCGEIVTCNTPNAFFTEGYIHEDCGHKSFPKELGLIIEKKIERGVKNGNKN